MAILTVPLPLLRDLHVHWSKKLLVTLLLCSGLFLISAAIVRVALTLGSAPSVLTVNSWGFRETVVAILAVSAPVLSPVLRPSFWTWGSYRGAALPKADAAAAVVRRKPFGNWLGTWELQSVGGSMESKSTNHMRTTMRTPTGADGGDLESGPAPDGPVSEDVTLKEAQDEGVRFG